MNNRTLHHVDLGNLFIFMALVLAPVIMLFPFLHTGQMAIVSDWAFHSARVQQIKQNLLAGHFLTFIGTNQFMQVGSANFLFYPTMFLYPWACLQILISNQIIAFYIYMLFIYWGTIGIAFYSMYKFSSSRLEAFTFALVYLIIPYHLYLSLVDYVLGEALAYMFFPLVLLGTWRLLFHYKWKTLAIALTLLGYTHIVSVIIALEIITLLTLIKFIIDKRVDFKAIRKYIFAGVITFILVAWELIPFLTDYHNLYQPAPGFRFVAPLGEMIQAALGNQATNNGGVGLLSIIAALLGWKACNSKVDWTIYLFGIFILLTTTTIMPWHFLLHTPLNIIQMPFRYNSFAGLFLSIILAKLISQLIVVHNYSKLTSLISVFILSEILFFGSVQIPLERNQNLNNNITYLQPKKILTIQLSIMVMIFLSLLHQKHIICNSIMELFMVKLTIGL